MMGPQDRGLAFDSHVGRLFGRKCGFDFASNGPRSLGGAMVAWRRRDGRQYRWLAHATICLEPSVDTWLSWISRWFATARGSCERN
jgi:hypothetical protein